MTDREITENNKLIAEFMGYDVKKVEKGFLILYKDGKYSGEFDTNGNSYHKSWDWLMPAFQKCVSILQEVDDGYTGWEDFAELLDEKWEELFEDAYSYFLDNNINEVYKVTVEFIKWYKEYDKTR